MEKVDRIIDNIIYNVNNFFELSEYTHIIKRNDCLSILFHSL